MDKKDECYYCGSVGDLQFFEVEDWGRGPIVAYSYHCPMCGYSWRHDVKVGQNRREFPINHPTRLKGRAA